VNHTCFPKEDQLPDWARRDYRVRKGDRVGRDPTSLRVKHFIDTEHKYHMHLKFSTLCSSQKTDCTFL